MRDPCQALPNGKGLLGIGYFLIAAVIAAPHRELGKCFVAVTRSAARILADGSFPQMPPQDARRQTRSPTLSLPQPPFFFTVFTQSWLSRYHFTVSRRPRSKVWAGVQPSSR